MSQLWTGVWTVRSHAVLRENFRTMPYCLTEKELRRRMIPWYPFDERKGWRYRCWLKACKLWRDAYAQGRGEVVIPGRRKRRGAPDNDTIEMFPEYQPVRKRRR